MTCILSFAIGASGAQVGSIAAASAAKGWLQSGNSPLGAKLGNQVASVETFKDASGAPIYHVVNLKPSGFVIVSGEDQTEPIIAFVNQGRFDPSENNPLGALVSRDLPRRVANARQHTSKFYGLKNQSKWQKLQLSAASSTAAVQPKGISSGSISDIRVAPFIPTSWSQSTTDGTTNGLACYNFFTPPHENGNPYNAVCGCVATAMAQLMYYHKYPSTGVGTDLFTFTFNKNPVQWLWPLRGGDGYGGPYDWANMPLDPSASNPTLVERMAIGSLTYDAGLAVHMQYSDTPAGSGAYLSDAETALVRTFKYGNAILTEASTINVGYDLGNMINPNLDAHMPVIFGIDNSVGGHAIVCDGYGYSHATLYHHLNMGWGGAYNAWYHLPLIDLPENPYYNFNACLYNVFPTGSGEIISGRVLDTNGLPMPGVSVSASSSKGGVFSVTTDASGIYALVGVPSASTCIITVTNAGCFPLTSNIVTGTSSDLGTNCGNVWGANFTLVPAQGPPIITLQPANLSTTIGSTATFTTYAIGQLPLAYQWQYQTVGSSTWINVTNSGISSGSQTPSLSIGPTDFTMSGEIFQCVVTNPLGSVTSAPPVWLSVRGLSPAFVIQPESQIVLEGSNVTFGAFATGTPSISYQWQYQPSGSLTWVNVTDDGTNSGSQTTTLAINPVDLTMNGKPFHCVAVNSWGGTTSSPVNLGVRADNSHTISLGTLAGLTITSGSTDGSNTNARFSKPFGIAVDSHTNIFVADMYNQVIRKLTPTGSDWAVSTIAGMATVSGSADGTGTNARFNAPYGITVDAGGNVFVTDTYNQTIRKLTPSGTNWVVSTIAGLAGTSGTADGSNARFNHPMGIAADNGGNLYVTDESNHTIRKLAFNGLYWAVSTLAGGSGGTNDGINGSAQFQNPYGITVNAAGTVFVVDQYFNTVRQLTPTGTNWVVTTIAGNGNPAGGSADGLGSAARFKNPTGIAASMDGNLYVADFGNNIIRRLAPAGSGWTVFTVAGLAGSAGSVNGVGTSIRLNGPFGITVDLNTNVYVSDSINNTIRGTVLPSAPVPSIVNLTMGANNTLAVSWNAKVAQTYLVQFKTNLNQPAWSNLTSITTTNWTGTAFVPISVEPQRFYRVITAP